MIANKMLYKFLNLFLVNKLGNLPDPRRAGRGLLLVVVISTSAEVVPVEGSSGDREDDDGHHDPDRIGGAEAHLRPALVVPVRCEDDHGHESPADERADDRVDQQGVVRPGRVRRGRPGGVPEEHLACGEAQPKPERAAQQGDAQDGANDVVDGPQHVSSVNSMGCQTTKVGGPYFRTLVL